MSGIIKGDEIMVINGAIVSDLDMMYLESVLQEELSLVMMMRYLYMSHYLFSLTCALLLLLLCVYHRDDKFSFFSPSSYELSSL